jgi:hypothetical protein
MFNVEKIKTRVSEIENSVGEFGANPNPNEYNSQMHLIQPFKTFVKNLEKGFESFNPQFYGNRILSIQSPGIYLLQDFLVETEVLYAGIVQGRDDSMMNLFMVVEMGDYAFAVNTNTLRNHFDTYFACKKEYAGLLMSVLFPNNFYREYVFQSVDLEFRGSIVDCLAYFKRVKDNLPDKMRDGFVEWSKNNICFLQSLIHKPELLYDFERAEFDQNKHPEIRPGEIFMGNWCKKDVDYCGYNSKRLGVVAFDIYGKAMNGLYPMFVLREEYNKYQAEQLIAI